MYNIILITYYFIRIIYQFMISQNSYQISNPKIHQLALFYQQGSQPHKSIDINYHLFPQGFFVGKLNAQIISKIFYFNYQNKYGYIGGYYVKQQYRKKGYGVQLFNKVVQQLRECQFIKLFCKEQMTKFYSKRGFTVFCRIHKRFIAQIPIIDCIRNSLIITKKEQINLKKVVQFDYKYTHYNRAYFVEQNLLTNNSFVSINRDTNQVMGYCCMSKFTQNDYIVNIMIAANDQIAQDLIKQVLISFKIMKGNESQMKLYFYILGIKESIMNLGVKWFPYLSVINYVMVLRNKADTAIDYSHCYSIYKN